MHTQSYISRTPSNHADIGEFSQTMAESLTLEDFESLSYKEQAMFHQLFPTAYNHLIEEQEQTRNAKQGRYTYDDFVARVARLDGDNAK